MARNIYYSVAERPENFISDDEWEQIKSLQRWYDLEFIWTGGHLNLKKYLIFPNYDKVGDNLKIIRARMQELERFGYTESEIINVLQKEALIFVRKGGYQDGMIASGFTRVADNEFNAFLVLDFIIKASRIASSASFEVVDEGRFVKPQRITIRNGAVIVYRKNVTDEAYKQVFNTRKVFSIVNPGKYDNHPVFSNIIDEFSIMSKEDLAKAVANWNWLGYDSKQAYDFNGDDIEGFDLNMKVDEVQLK
ncbi:MAG: hypothetical protein ACP5US_06935 [Candidatus Kryptoniota bacterium]